MAQTTEQRKIKRLETQIKKYKEDLDRQRTEIRKLEGNLYNERQWRRQFQSLLKEAVMEDSLKDVDREYW